MIGALARALLLVTAVAAHDMLPVNPELGVPGFPDCVQPVAALRGNTTDVKASANSLICAQRTKDFGGQKSVACVGDSITAGVHASEADFTYPAQLQHFLGDAYKVTNLGACGSTMMKGADSPYWKRPQFQALTASKWDIVVIMLGTNDAKDIGHGGPANWPHDCTGESQLSCAFSKDYASMIELVKTLGNSSSPDIYLMIPPPLMLDGAYGMNQTVINKVFPELIPAIAKNNGLEGKVVDLFSPLGGDDQKDFPAGGCTVPKQAVAGCQYFCASNQAWKCDQCHPDNTGYRKIEDIVRQAIAPAGRSLGLVGA